MTRPPIIGITASWAPFKKGRPFFPDSAFDYLKCEYYEPLARLGALPLIIPNLLPEQWPLLDTIARQMDGLLLSGGSDLAPDLFGQDELPASGCVVRRRRDELELELLRRWNLIRPHGPILAICRGHQVLNTLYGGSLFQDFDACGVETIPQGHRTPEKRRTYHDVEVLSGTLLSEVIGAGRHRVNSSHHQGIDRLADGFIVSARAEDGIIEAMEMEDRTRWLVSVQWHPEAMDNDESARIFAAFVAACAT